MKRESIHPFASNSNQIIDAALWCDIHIRYVVLSDALFPTDLLRWDKAALFTIVPICQIGYKNTNIGVWHFLVQFTFRRISWLPQDRCWWCLLYKTRVLLEKPWTVPLCSVSNGSLLRRQKLVHITSILLQLAPGQDILKNAISWQFLALVFSADQHQTERRVAAW